MKIHKPYLAVLCGLLALAPACSEDEPVYAPPKPGPVQEVVGKAAVWLTTGSQSKLLSKEADVDVVVGTTSSNPSITLDFAQRLQEIEGFGAALTGSSAYLIQEVMNSAQRNALLTELFDPQAGIGISYLRTTMGASDFSLQNFTYNDLPAGQTDPELSQFSLARDQEHVVPVLQAIQQKAPNIKVMGSPWSAPAWMKTSGRLAGGSLKPEWYASYANYFVKYVQAYAGEGIEVDAVTIQNEPLHETTAYPSMRMEAAEQANFIKNHLGPAFEQAGIGTKIIIYDHNFDRLDYPLTILNDPQARQYVDGTAFHAYAGNASAMSQVRNAFPELGLYFTEISGGGWATNFADNLKWNLSNIFIGTTRNWSKTALLWNLALNESSGPKNGGCQDCRGVVTISASGQLSRNVEYYALGHFSKFVRPGAFRVQSGLFASSTGLESVAFQNPDGSKVLVVLNTSATAQKFTAIDGQNSLSYTLEGNSVATLVWQ